MKYCVCCNNGERFFASQFQISKIVWFLISILGLNSVNFLEINFENDFQ